MRLYRALLLLYPASFRGEYGGELARVFAERRRLASGPFEVAVLWLETIPDTLLNATRVHLDILRQDLRYTLRSLAGNRGFAITAVLVTALGIGANTAVFSITDHVFIRPLPYADADRLVKVWEDVPGYTRMEASPPNYLDWQRMSRSFETMGAFTVLSANMASEAEPKRLTGATLSTEVLQMLGVAPLMGRLFTSDDDEPGAGRTAILSYSLWQSAFGGRTDILGVRVRLDEMEHVVVGVMPPSFTFPNRETEIWTPLQFSPERGDDDRDNNYLHVLARLKPGVTATLADAEMDVVAEQLERAYPRENAKTRATVHLLRDDVPTQARLLVFALGGASVCLLLIACTNLASLLLARVLQRRKELSLRTALGAGRERLVRQLITESLLLSTVGGAIGVVVAVVAVPLLAQLVPDRLPIGEATAIDGRVLLFAALVTAVTGLAFGVVPALRVASDRDMGGLREGSRGGAGGKTERLRAVLVAAEVTISVVLLISAGLLIRALWRVQSIEPGFQTERVLAVETPLAPARHGVTARRVDLYSRILADVRALPGVASAAYISFVPMTMRGGIWPVRVVGPSRMPQELGEQRAASLRYVTPGLFGTLRIPLHVGRDISESDTMDADGVAVVSESFVKRYFPDGDPLGRRFEFAFRERTIVGVVGDIRVRGLERSSEPQVYLSYQQVADNSIIFYMPKELVVRTQTDPLPLVPAIRQIVSRADPTVPIAAVRTLGDVVAADTASRTTQLRVLGAFAALSLLLAGVGLHGLLSFAVSQRVPEISLRMALGARRGDVLRLVIRQGFALAMGGAVVGMGLAYAAGRWMEALLAGVTPGDLVTFGAAAAVALLMTISGTLLPALRAVRVDPATVLRAE